MLRLRTQWHSSIRRYANFGVVPHCEGREAEWALLSLACHMSAVSLHIRKEKSRWDAIGRDYTFCFPVRIRFQPNPTYMCPLHNRECLNLYGVGSLWRIGATKTNEIHMSPRHRRFSDTTFPLCCHVRQNYFDNLIWVFGCHNLHWTCLLRNYVVLTTIMFYNSRTYEILWPKYQNLFAIQSNDQSTNSSRW